MAIRSTRVAEEPDAGETVPTRLSAGLFRLKVAGHQFRRAVGNFVSGLGRLDRADRAPYTIIAGISRTALWSDDRASEAVYQQGKVHNLRIAAEALDRTLLLPGCMFSFWKQVGRATRSGGYVSGRMLQQGCLIPAIGGGLCQLSNALYEVALQTGCEIVERHAHSRVVPGSAAVEGRDATVAWNYIDLRFQAPCPMLIRAEIARGQLVVSFWLRPGTRPETRPGELGRLPGSAAAILHRVASTCGTCTRTRCFRREN